MAVDIARYQAPGTNRGPSAYPSNLPNWTTTPDDFPVNGLRPQSLPGPTTSNGSVYPAKMRSRARTVIPGGIYKVNSTPTPSRFASNPSNHSTRSQSTTRNRDRSKPSVGFLITVNHSARTMPQQVGCYPVRVTAPRQIRRKRDNHHQPPRGKVSTVKAR
jgi:hypothetical protein